MKILIVASLLILKIVRAIDIRQMPVYNQRLLEFRRVPITTVGQPLLQQKRCNFNNILVRYPSNDIMTNKGRNARNNIQRAKERHQWHRDQHQLRHNFGRRGDTDEDTQIDSPVYNLTIPFDNQIERTYERTGHTYSSILSKLNEKLEKLHSKHLNRHLAHIKKTAHEMPTSTTSSQEFLVTTGTRSRLSTTTEGTVSPVKFNFAYSLDEFQRRFYATTFEKLTSMSPPSRRENGMSFVQSDLFLQLALMTLLNEVDPEASSEIRQCLGLNISDSERIELINETISSLPTSSDNLKIRWSTRLVLRDQPGTLSEQFRSSVASAMRLVISSFNGTESPRDIGDVLNEMVEEDSGRAIHDTFEEDDFSDGFRAMLLSTIYFRARWRSSPTLLNGTHRFLDSNSAPKRTVRMIRINDVMRYSNLTEWDAEALEILYSTPGLSLLMLVPRSNSLSSLVEHAANTSIQRIEEKMRSTRIAATLPLYTLRMTLLLPNKLEAMGLTHLLETKNVSHTGKLRLSHAVQRIMFWAEAGRNAYKDDGIEWDTAPEFELLVDRPYIFYVRWKNKTLLNGNFVL